MRSFDAKLGDLEGTLIGGFSSDEDGKDV